MLKKLSSNSNMAVTEKRGKETEADHHAAAWTSHPAGHTTGASATFSFSSGSDLFASFGSGSGGLGGRQPGAAGSMACARWRATGPCPDPAEAPAPNPDLAAVAVPCQDAAAVVAGTAVTAGGRARTVGRRRIRQQR
uniref:Uncharacterized protein n=1 Tax=Oryza rufipogon TaxID=4529 RepID=A0A0E0QPL7_ORYRU